MPKYGFISSRKYVLREVIRLRDIEARWASEIVTGNVRSAFVPETKVQVYFLELANYFDEVDQSLYTNDDDEPLAENIHRFGLFSKIALRTLEKLFWQPDIVIANDWTSAFSVLLQKKLFIREEFFSKGKSIFMLHSLDEHLEFSADALFNAEVDPDDMPVEVTDSTRLIDLAAAVADEVILVNSSETNMEDAVDNDKQMQDILNSRDSAPKIIEAKAESDEEWQEVASQVEEVIQEVGEK
jgi:starch synthase